MLLLKLTAAVVLPPQTAWSLLILILGATDTTTESFANELPHSLETDKVMGCTPGVVNVTVGLAVLSMAIDPPAKVHAYAGVLLPQFVTAAVGEMVTVPHG